MNIINDKIIDLIAKYFYYQNLNKLKNLFDSTSIVSWENYTDKDKYIAEAETLILYLNKADIELKYTNLVIDDKENKRFIEYLSENGIEINDK